MSVFVGYIVTNLLCDGSVAAVAIVRKTVGHAAVLEAVAGRRSQGSHELILG
jgi:hypothetical protein